MAIRYECDGCGGDLPAHVPCEGGCDDHCTGCANGHDGDVVGRIDSAHYCNKCATAWREYDEAFRAKRVTMIREMESFIRGREGALKATLRRLPD